MALSPTESDHYRAELRLTQRRQEGQSRSTEELVESLERDISEYRECVDALGTSLDRDKFRRELPALRDNIQRKITTVENDLQSKRDSGGSGLIVKRISERLQHQKDKFNQLVNKETTQKMSTHNSDDAELGGAYYRADNTFQAQQQSTAAALETREKEAQAMQGLERDILDLNEINRDMNVMVHEQGDDINRIEHHTERAADRVAVATNDTNKIRVLHWRNRKMMIIIGGVIAGVVVAIIIALIIIISIAVCAPPGGSC